MSDWLILRVASRRTLSLAASLAQDGYDVWTPVEQRTIRIPRANIRRLVTRAMLEGFVFARTKHLVDLLELAKMPVKPRRGAGLREPAHANFSIFRQQDRIPLIADHHFDEIRRIEAKRTPATKAERAFAKDAIVKVASGSFGGMVGAVEQSNRLNTHVCFNDRYVVTIPTCLLNPDDIPIARDAAQAA